MSKALTLLGRVNGPVRTYLEQAFALVAQAGDDEAALWEISARGEQMEMAGRLIAGLANRELSKRVDTGRLKREVHARGLSWANFFYSIQALESFEALPDQTSVALLSGLGWTKMRAILPWTQEERAALAQGKEVHGLTIDAAAEMPSREFEKLARRAPEVSPELAEARNRAQLAENKLLAWQEEQRRTNRILAEVDLPLACREAIDESCVNGRLLLWIATTLRDTRDRTLKTRLHDEASRRHQPAAAHTFVHALSGPLLELLHLVREVAADYDIDAVSTLLKDEVPDSISAPLVIERAKQLIDATEAAASARSDKRHNDTTGRRGAPRGKREGKKS